MSESLIKELREYYLGAEIPKDYDELVKEFKELYNSYSCLYASINMVEEQKYSNQQEIRLQRIAINSLIDRLDYPKAKQDRAGILEYLRASLGCVAICKKDQMASHIFVDLPKGSIGTITGVVAGEPLDVNFLCNGKTYILNYTDLIIVFDSAITRNDEPKSNKARRKAKIIKRMRKSVFDDNN